VAILRHEFLDALGCFLGEFLIYFWRFFAKNWALFNQELGAF